MIDVNIKIDDGMKQPLQNMIKELQQYPKDAEAKFVSLTPIRSGNARNHTRLRGNSTIEANYPYAQRLDNGWSKQAPAGMTKPFEAWVKQKVKQIFGK